MKQIATLILMLAAHTILPNVASAQCNTIQRGTLLYQPSHYLAGQPISTGVNTYGYNYQAHSFNGSYFNAYAGRAGFPPYDGDDLAYLAANPTAVSHSAWPYRSVDLAMKWNDAWLSNKDCDGDGLLDLHFGFAGYKGSGAWLTNHNSWATVDTRGREKRASEFIKIAAIPVDAMVAGPAGYFGELTIYVNGQIMGSQIWGELAVIQYILNDPSTADHGLMLKGQISSGFGFFKP